MMIDKSDTEEKRINLVNYKSDEELMRLINAPYDEIDNNDNSRVLSKEKFQERVKKHGLGLITYISHQNI